MVGLRDVFVCSSVMSGAKCGVNPGSYVGALCIGMLINELMKG